MGSNLNSLTDLSGVEPRVAVDILSKNLDLTPKPHLKLMIVHSRLHSKLRSVFVLRSASEKAIDISLNRGVVVRRGAGGQ
jgi:hypothetical protein